VLVVPRDLFVVPGRSAVVADDVVDECVAQDPERLQGTEQSPTWWSVYSRKPAYTFICRDCDDLPDISRCASRRLAVEHVRGFRAEPRARARIPARALSSTRYAVSVPQIAATISSSVERLPCSTRSSVNSIIGIPNSSNPSTTPVKIS
jgi:hypothetical protein